jgi:hypothetical protein
MTTVSALRPGDLDAHAGHHAVYIAQTEHPIWPHLRLVIWRLEDGMWSHDALDWRQDIGTVTPSTAAEREQRLRVALLGERTDTPIGYSPEKWASMSRQQRRAILRRLEQPTAAAILLGGGESTAQGEAEADHG